MPMSYTMRLNSARKRFAEYFSLSDKVIGQLEEWIEKEDIPMPQTYSGIVKFAAMVRAFNLYKSINLLLGNDHWEDAAILSRSVFELLLNLEEIASKETDIEEKAFRFLRHNKLCETLHYLNDRRYVASTGRGLPGDIAELEKMEKELQRIFPEFVDTKRGQKWNQSWCGKTVRRLATDSGKPIRIAQYNLIYSYFSEFSHSSPFATMTTAGLGQTEEEIEKLLKSKKILEKEGLARVLVLSTTWLLEILNIAKTEIPPYELAWSLEILEELFRLFKLSTSETGDK